MGALIRSRKSTGFDRRMSLCPPRGEDVLVSVSHTVDRPDWPDEPATVIRFREGKAIEMRQFRSREKALTAAASQN